MKLTPTHYLIILGLAFFILGVYAIQITGENNAKDDALELFKTESASKLEQLEHERDSISKIAETYREAAESDFEEGEDLEEEIKNLENKDYENEPYRINNADSLRDLIARRFYKR